MWQCLLFPVCMCLPQVPFIIELAFTLGNAFAAVVLILNFFQNYSYENNIYREWKFFRKLFSLLYLAIPFLRFSYLLQ